MPAGIKIKLCLGRLPTRIPYRVLILNIVIAPAPIQRAVIIAVAGQPKQFCILIEGIPACRIGNQTKKSLLPR